MAASGSAPSRRHVRRSSARAGRSRAAIEFRGRGGPGGGPRELDIAVTLPDGAAITFRTNAPHAAPPLPLPLLLELGFVALVLGVVLYAMARTITRPLAELATAAEGVGRGARMPLRETGARELREATRAFNTMQERLHRYLDSRTRVLSAMSHDLRTPLTRLKLRTESLDDAALRERFNADLDEMQRMVTGALNLFRGMNHDEPLQTVDVGALVAELKARAGGARHAGRGDAARRRRCPRGRRRSNAASAICCRTRPSTARIRPLRWKTRRTSSSFAFSTTGPAFRRRCSSKYSSRSSGSRARATPTPAAWGSA